MSQALPIDPAERERRRQLAWLIATSHAARIVPAIDEARGAIVERFHPAEQSLILADWPLCRQAIVASVPEVCEAMLDLLAETFSTTILTALEKRCRTSTPTPPGALPSSSSGSAA